MAEKVEHLANLVGAVDFTFSLRETNLEAHALARIATTLCSSGSFSVDFLNSSISKDEFFCTVELPRSLNSTLLMESSCKVFG